MQLVNKKVYQHFHKSPLGSNVLFLGLLIFEPPINSSLIHKKSAKHNRTKEEYKGIKKELNAFKVVLLDEQPMNEKTVNNVLFVSSSSQL